MVQRKSRRRRRANNTGSAWIRERLTSGHDYAFLEGRPEQDDQVDLAAEWAKLREEILAEHIAQHPGSRPAGWWEFEAPEPRRQIGGGPSILKSDAPAWARTLFLGMPACWGLEQFADPPRFETQGQYLERLGLLRPGEAIHAGGTESDDFYSKTYSRSDQVALEQGHLFDNRAACHVERFFVRFLKHSHKPFAGQPFVSQPWQRDQILRPLFGWRLPAGPRRFRRAFVFIPKKNGKTTFCAGLVLYTTTDDEAAAEVYGTATEAEQSGRLLAECERMIQKSPELSAACRVVRSERKIFCGDSYYLALAGDSAAGSEGANAYCLIQDELHAWNTPQLRKLWSSFYYSDEARQNALSIVITTAGDDDPDQLWIEEYAYAKQIARGDVIDLERLVFLAEAEEGDDWLDPAVWQKANPGWGVTINPERFAARAEEAKHNDRVRRDFLRYRLNRPVGSLSGWLPEELWNACAELPSFPTGSTLCGGLDLSARSDFTALVFVRREQQSEAGDGEVLGDEQWPEDVYHVWPKLWVPEETIARQERDGKLLYRQWQREGWIEAIPGPVIREGFVINQVAEVAASWEIHEIGYDPWNALEEAMKLINDHGVPMIVARQGVQTLSPPMKKLEQLLALRKIRHGGHPVLRWMFKNVQVITDQNGNIRPVKAAKNSPKKIDGILALVMAIWRAMLLEEERSVYENRGVVSF